MAYLVMNRQIVLEARTFAQDSTGFEVEQWLPARTTWADRRDIQASERFRSQQEIAERTSVFTIRWFTGLNAKDWRIVHDSLTWDVIGLAEPRNTRRQYWEITAVASGA